MPPINLITYTVSRLRSLAQYHASNSPILTISTAHLVNNITASHVIYRRDPSSSSTVGLTIGITLISIVIVVGVYYYFWRKDEKKRKKSCSTCGYKHLTTKEWNRCKLEYRHRRPRRRRGRDHGCEPTTCHADAAPIYHHRHHHSHEPVYAYPETYIEEAEEVPRHRRERGERRHRRHGGDRTEHRRRRRRNRMQTQMQDLWRRMYLTNMANPQQQQQPQQAAAQMVPPPIRIPNEMDAPQDEVIGAPPVPQQQGAAQVGDGGLAAAALQVNMMREEDRRRRSRDRERRERDRERRHRRHGHGHGHGHGRRHSH